MIGRFISTTRERSIIEWSRGESLRSQLFLYDIGYRPCFYTLLQRCHVDHKPKLHISSEDPFVGFIHLVDGNHFHVGLDLVLGTEVEHVLYFFDAADEGTGEVVDSERKWFE